MFVQNLKNKLLRVIFGWFLLLLLFFCIFFGFNLIPSKIKYDNNFGVETNFKRLVEYKKYETSFFSNYNNLNRIDVLFKNPNLESRDELKIVVKDSLDNEIHSQKFTGFNFGDTSYARLDFNSITDSKDKEFLIEILPTKIIDGKLFFGTNNNTLSFVQYFRTNFNIRNTFDISLSLLSNWVLLLPFITVTLFLW